LEAEKFFRSEYDNGRSRSQLRTFKSENTGDVENVPANQRKTPKMLDFYKRTEEEELLKKFNTQLGISKYFSGSICLYKKTIEKTTGDHLGDIVIN
jgi:hypothetical protein